MPEPSVLTTAHQQETRAGERFGFGANWSAFLRVLDDQRIATAEQSLRDKLGVETLEGKTFLDIGSGSGLFSLCARRLGATVRSFDYDPQSVACTAELRRRYFPDDPAWTVEQGSVLDEEYMNRLGTCDVVYSWGVLHHTGQMWRALENATARVKPGGKFFISIYNDQGGTSNRWRAVKKLYCRAPKPLKPLVVLGVGAYWEGKTFLANVARLRNPLPFKRWAMQREMRGMSYWHDLVDWTGGYPFEVAKPEEIFNFGKQRGFTLLDLMTCGGGHGCNQFVFRKDT
jgi:2-polyprenyl-3-methyl-5-hydroxy-6-metoxy-1,4-benzoquinol methylase